MEDPLNLLLRALPPAHQGELVKHFQTPSDPILNRA
jgi:hypothetical protein